MKRLNDERWTARCLAHSSDSIGNHSVWYPLNYEQSPRAWGRG